MTGRPPSLLLDKQFVGVCGINSFERAILSRKSLKNKKDFLETSATKKLSKELIIAFIMAVVAGVVIELIILLALHLTKI